MCATAEIAWYTVPGRFTEFHCPLGHMLDAIPSDIQGICRVASEQTVHANLLGYYGISNSERKVMERVWPPKFSDILTALEERRPHSLRGERLPIDRVIGACVLESHFLAGLLRAKGLPSRVRTGYFRNVQTNRATLTSFWKVALKARGVDQDRMLSDPEGWNLGIEEFVGKQIRDNHHIEHWVCEYWNASKEEWIILDANTTFLKALSNIHVPYELPREHYEYASEAWARMRENPESFNCDQYAEEPLDGRSHIRYHLVSDFLSLLNHDLPSDSEHGSPGFVKGRKYEDLSNLELDELDRLAALVSNNPTIGQLREFYRESHTLRFQPAEDDPHSFISKR